MERRKETRMEGGERESARFFECRFWVLDAKQQQRVRETATTPASRAHFESKQSTLTERKKDKPAPPPPHPPPLYSFPTPSPIHPPPAQQAHHILNRQRRLPVVGLGRRRGGGGEGGALLARPPAARRQPRPPSAR